MEFLSCAAALVTIVAFLSPYVGILEAVVLDAGLLAAAVIIGLLTRPRARPDGSTADPSAKEEQKTRYSTSAPTQLASEQIIVSRSFDVKAGKLTKVELSVEKGDYVFGRLEEEDKFWFSWYIVDIKNLRKAEQSRTFDYEAGENDVPSTALDWTVPSNGPWYLVLDVSMKQYVRRVTVNLKRRPKSVVPP